MAPKRAADSPPEGQDPADDEDPKRPRQDEHTEAEPQAQVRPRAMLCKACLPAAALVLTLVAALASYRGDSLLYSTEASASMAPPGLMHPSFILQLLLAITDLLSGEGHSNHSNSIGRPLSPSLHITHLFLSHHLTLRPSQRRPTPSWKARESKTRMRRSTCQCTPPN
jgi:hypothetical protein